jgi:5-methylthioadenosine/S-adenosylhomocysteine deaminase
VKCGVTTVNDMYRRLEALARAADEIGIRAVLSNDVADAEHELDTLDDTRTAYAVAHGAGDGRVEVAVGIEWLPMASEGLLREARALVDELGVKFHIHLNESMTEVDNSLERFGRRPTEVAYDCGVLGPDCVAAHCVWLSDREIGLMAETGTHISHNPISNAKLANGVARLPEMLAAGINVGIGHDAAESSNTRDLFQVMKLASIIHRAVRQDASLGQPADILRMATLNGGRALGHQTGRLAPGWKADVILLDLSGPMFVPLLPEHKEQLYSHLVFAANGSCVDTTIIDGQVVMAGRQLTTIDEELVCRKANEAFASVLERMVVPTDVGPDAAQRRESV